MIRPFKGKRALIRCFKSKHEKLIKSRGSQLSQSTFRLASLLRGMQKTAFASRGVAPGFAFVADISLGAVYANDAHANRVPATLLEFRNLISKIVNHPVDLFDHGLGKDFYLDANLYSRDSASRYTEALINYGCLSRYDFSERPIATSSRDTMPLILDV